MPLHRYHGKEGYGNRTRSRTSPAHFRGLANVFPAKHLEQLKGGRFPIEVLVRGKDAEENETLFVKIADAINSAGVSHPTPRFATPIRVPSFPSPRIH
jgi:hypothetical protein